MTSKKLVLTFGLATSLAHISAGAWTKGSALIPSNGAVFLSKFCFDFNPNSIAGDDSSLSIGEVDVFLQAYQTEPGKPDDVLELVMLDDQRISYSGSSQLEGFKCGSSQLKSSARLHKVIKVSELLAGGLRDVLGPAKYVHESLRPRWWFVAIVDCAGVERRLDYEVHMTNTLQGWLQEFPMDRCGPVTLIVFLLLYAILAFAQISTVAHGWFSTGRGTERTNGSLWHPLRIMLTAGCVSAANGVLFSVLNAFWYASQGEDSLLLFYPAKILKAISKYSLFCMLLLLSTGRGISFPLQCHHVFVVSTVLVPFSLMCLLLEVWGEYAQSRKYTTDFVYCSWLGGLLILADLLLLCLYLCRTLASHRAEVDPVKKMFYGRWALVYSTAFLGLPASTIVSLFVSPWVQSMVLVILSNTIYLVCLALLVAGLWPEKEQPYFDLANVGPVDVYGVDSDSLDSDLLNKTKVGTINFI